MPTEMFGNTALEARYDKFLMCREIVKTILDFGVDQQQILRIIKLLGLELIDSERTAAIAAVVRPFEDADASALETETLITR